MLALVTGSTGFIGSQLCRGLLEAGWQVRAFHRPTSRLEALEGLEVEYAAGDVTRPESLKPALRGVEAVFHAAAMLGQPRRPESMYAVTVGGARNVLAAAVEAGVSRVVLTSSVAALGPPVELDPAGSLARARPGGPSAWQPEDFRLLDENHTWNYRPEWWPYGHAKYLAELEVQRAVASGLDCVIVNPAVVLGPGDINRVSGDIVIKTAQRRVPAAVGGGLNVIHVRDVVRGHLAALERGRRGERYILSGENLTVAGLLALIAEEAGVPAPRLTLPARLVRPLAGPAVLLGRFLPLPLNGGILRRAGHNFWYDSTKAQRELGLTGLLSSRQAIRDALQWYRQRGDLG